MKTSPLSRTRGKLTKALAGIKAQCAAPTPVSFPHLEEIPYETNDKAGGYYLHFDNEGSDSLYLSKATTTPAVIESLRKLCARASR